ncbi:hypothetical protein FIBSPDRAFT_1023900 [Athelia psychrophila]|uniref:Uncharacterized protein n=1 Tax=Athelia psychrophila TaxID=1759441 RepID=A0A166UYD5_9AGAM|nr:hypothetical protein FIBSPDRAFT_1023900 [Fibularhizoctonia sp. CBS 109695]
MNVIVSKQSPEMTLIRSWHSSTHIQLQSSNEREHCNFHALVDRATRKVTTSWLWFGFTAAYSFSRHGRVYSELHQTHLISAANTRIPMGAAYQNISALIIELNSKTIGGLARTQPFVHTDIASDFFGYSIVGIELVDVTLTSPPEPVHILILNMPCLGYHDKFVTNIWIQFRYTATVSGGNARAIYIFRWAVGDVDAPASLKASKLHQSWESAVVPRPTASACATTGDAPTNRRILDLSGLMLDTPHRRICIGTSSSGPVCLACVVFAAIWSLWPSHYTREKLNACQYCGHNAMLYRRSTLNPDPGWLDLGFKFS